MDPKDLRFASGANTADHWRTEVARQLERTSRLDTALRAERRARNTFALLALTGWVVALALLGHGGAV